MFERQSVDANGTDHPLRLRAHRAGGAKKLATRGLRSNCRARWFDLSKPGQNKARERSHRGRVYRGKRRWYPFCAYVVPLSYRSAENERPGGGIVRHGKILTGLDESRTN